MLAQLTARLRARQGDPGVPGGGIVVGEDGEAVLVDDNCTVSSIYTINAPLSLLSKYTDSCIDHVDGPQS